MMGLYPIHAVRMKDGMLEWRVAGRPVQAPPSPETAATPAPAATASPTTAANTASPLEAAS